MLPVGDAVSLTLLLQKHTRTLGWPLAASAAVLSSIAPMVRTGRHASLKLSGRSVPIEAVELVSLLHA